MEAGAILAVIMLVLIVAIIIIKVLIRMSALFYTEPYLGTAGLNIYCYEENKVVEKKKFVGHIELLIDGEIYEVNDASIQYDIGNPCVMKTYINLKRKSANHNLCFTAKMRAFFSINGLSVEYTFTLYPHRIADNHYLGWITEFVDTDKNSVIIDLNKVRVEPNDSVIEFFLDDR